MPESQRRYLYRAPSWRSDQRYQRCGPRPIDQKVNAVVGSMDICWRCHGSHRQLRQRSWTQQREAWASSGGLQNCLGLPRAKYTSALPRLSCIQLAMRPIQSPAHTRTRLNDWGPMATHIEQKGCTHLASQHRMDARVGARCREKIALLVQVEFRTPCCNNKTKGQATSADTRIL